MKTFLVGALAGTLLLTGCVTHKHTARVRQNIITVSPQMVHSGQFTLVWDSIYEHQTNVYLHPNGTKTIRVGRNTNIVYNIYRSSNPTAPMKKWQKVATVATTNYTCMVTNFPEYFTVRSMDLRSKLESRPAK